jgi:hypothetical protein
METTPDSHRLAAVLLGRIRPATGAPAIADAMISLWREIESALGPVIGAGGLAALHGRALHQASAAHSWLPARESVDGTVDLTTLRFAVSQQTAGEATGACASFFRSFYELLDSLVGGLLTEQLLAPIWAHAPSGFAALGT